MGNRSLMHKSVRHWAVAGVLSLTAAVVMLCPTSVCGQSVDTTITGRVSDENGGGLVGATVTIRNEANGLARSTSANQDGHYQLLDLPAGTYELRAELNGFGSNIRQAQPLYVGTAVSIDFVLKIAGVTETVTVRGALPLLEAGKSTLTRIVQSEEIDALPVINRNFNDLAALAPGVTKTGVYGGVDIPMRRTGFKSSRS